jgi:hypothetical protein
MTIVEAPSVAVGSAGETAPLSGSRAQGPLRELDASKGVPGLAASRVAAPDSSDRSWGIAGARRVLRLTNGDSQQRCGAGDGSGAAFGSSAPGEPGRRVVGGRTGGGQRPPAPPGVPGPGNPGHGGEEGSLGARLSKEPPAIGFAELAAFVKADYARHKGDLAEERPPDSVVALLADKLPQVIAHSGPGQINSKTLSQWSYVFSRLGASMLGRCCRTPPN